jgi:hypothetical protein
MGVPSIDIGASPDLPSNSAAGSDDRHINAWIEVADGPLVKGRKYWLLVNIGQFRSEALISPVLPPIAWGNQREVPLVVMLSGVDFSVKPRLHRISLPKYGDTVPVRFDVIPLVSPVAVLRLTFYLELTLDLLAEFTVPIEIVELAAVV